MSTIRSRRLRRNSHVRDLVSETALNAKDLVMPYFVIEGYDRKEKIESMPGISRLSVDNLIKDIEEAKDLGIKAALLFGICRDKDEKGTESYSKSGIVQEAVRKIKKHIKDMVIITDVCLCGYTAHGHCGIVKKEKVKKQKAKIQAKRQNFYLDNDDTLKILAKIALSHAEAGADFVAPSAMMDGQVKSIREALDREGYQDAGILAYSAKYASSFYAPFREALGSHPQFGDRKSYQMDYRNSDEALREIALDIEEGADMVMVKPALAYLDIIYRAKERFNIPIAAYNVSGEYALVSCQPSPPEADPLMAEVVSHQLRRDLILEILTSIKRAGADLIITYHAKEAAKWLKH